MTSDEDRWSEAQSLLEGTPSEPALQRRRRGRWTFLLVLVIALAVGMAAGLAVIAWSGADGSESDDRPLWRSITGLLLILAGMVVAAPAVFRLIRANGLRDGWRTPLVALDMNQRRHLLRQVRGRVPADPAHLPLARHLAETLLRQVGTPTLVLGVVLLAAGQLSLSGSWFWAALLVLMVASWPLQVRRTSRIHEFLAQHPADPTL